MIPPTAATAANSALWTARSRVIKVCGPPPRNSSNDTAPRAARASIFSMLDGCASAWRAKSTMLLSLACAARSKAAALSIGRVRHGHHGGDPAARRGAGRRAEILLVGLPGITGVDVRIDDARKDEPLAGINYVLGTR